MAKKAPSPSRGQRGMWTADVPIPVTRFDDPPWDTEKAVYVPNDAYDFVAFARLMRRVRHDALLHEEEAGPLLQAFRKRTVLETFVVEGNHLPLYALAVCRIFFTPLTLPTFEERVTLDCWDMKGEVWRQINAVQLSRPTDTGQRYDNELDEWMRSAVRHPEEARAFEGLADFEGMS